MEYVQMTLNDWVEMKRKLRQELLGVKQSFVRIGYALRKIEDQKLYENDGYKSIAEFAKEEYGLEPSTTSRFMSINREYSIDGYSEQLRPEYADLGRSQLEEMLKKLSEDESFGVILRAKGMVDSPDGQWIYFDMVRLSETWEYYSHFFSHRFLRELYLSYSEAFV